MGACSRSRGQEQKRLRELIEHGGALALVSEPGVGETVRRGHASERAGGMVLIATGTESGPTSRMPRF